MARIKGGFTGRLLEVDLTAGKVEWVERDPLLTAKFLGGLGYNSRILFERTGPATDPMGPDNVLLFGTGPLTGTPAPFSGRMEVTTKSPLTFHFGSSNTGGDFGTYLKKAGFDGIFLRGAAASPLYLLIRDRSAELRDARRLWGKETNETEDILRRETGPDPRILTIGPAGENRVRFACLINENYHAAARSGVGAVMGAKNLKALAVCGTGEEIPIARPDAFREAVGDVYRLLRANPDFGRLQKTSSQYSQDAWSKYGCFPGKNFQTGYIPGWTESRGPDRVLSHVAGLKGVCYGCPFKCFKLAEIKEGKYAGLKVSSVGFVSSVYEFGAKIGIDNLPAIWKCKETCHRLGMDYGSASGVIAFAMELYEKGILSQKETDGLPLRWGDEDVVLELLRRIAHREGVGALLAEGSAGAAGRIGPAASRYVMNIKGLEMMWSDPRSAPLGWSLGYLFNPRGGDNTKTTHSLRVEEPAEGWGVDRFDIPREIKAGIYGSPPEIAPLKPDGKALYVKWMSDTCSAVSAAGSCILCVTRLGMGTSSFSRLVSAATGSEISPDELAVLGERVFNLMRLYIVREGLSRKDDHFPDRFYEEALPEGPAKGARLSREDIERLLDESYRLRGWDLNGVPTMKKAVELGLEKEAEKAGLPPELT